MCFIFVFVMIECRRFFSTSFTYIVGTDMYGRKSNQFSLNNFLRLWASMYVYSKIYLYSKEKSWAVLIIHERIFLLRLKNSYGNPLKMSTYKYVNISLIVYRRGKKFYFLPTFFRCDKGRRYYNHRNVFRTYVWLCFV